ncbi:MAG: hypothetical protein WDO18_12605 [Acidobacteriota bacterium]
MNVQVPPGTRTGPAVPISLELHLTDGSTISSNTVTIAVAAK